VRSSSRAGTGTGTAAARFSGWWVAEVGHTHSYTLPGLIHDRSGLGTPVWSMTTANLTVTAIQSQVSLSTAGSMQALKGFTCTDDGYSRVPRTNLPAQCLMPALCAQLPAKACAGCHSFRLCANSYALALVAAAATATCQVPCQPLGCGQLWGQLG